MRTSLKLRVFLGVALVSLALWKVQAALIDATSGGGPATPATGSVTPASITTSPGDFTFPTSVITEGASGATQATTKAAVVAYDSVASSAAIAITGVGISGSPASSDGMGIALMYSASNNRQLGFFDTGAGIGTSQYLQITITPGVTIDASDNLGNSEQLTVGGSKGVAFGGKATLKNVTTSQKNALTAQTGDVVYDTTLNAICVYNSSGTWLTVTAM